MICSSIDRNTSKLAYFVFNDIPSYDYNILVKSLPDIISPEKQVDRITVPGRNGYLYEDNQTFAEFDKKVECFIRNSYYLDDISAWLKGKGNVIFSNEKDKYYKAMVVNAIPFSSFVGKIRTFQVVFNCKPFKYSVDFEDDFLVTEDNTFNFLGKGTFDSEPVITVFGSGDITVTVNDSIIALTDVSEYIVLNSEVLDAYKGSVNQNMKMTGEFPLLKCNNQLNSISFFGDVSRTEIVPNWRWI